MTAYMLAVWALFPSALLLLGLLLLPLPDVLGLRRRVLAFVQTVLFSKVTLFSVHVRVVHFVALTTVLLTAWSTFAARSAQLHYQRGKEMGHSDQKALMLRFRSERNFWLSSFAMVLWLVVWAIHGLQTRIHQLETEKALWLQGQQRTGTTGRETTPSRPVKAVPVSPVNAAPSAPAADEGADSADPADAAGGVRQRKHRAGAGRSEPAAQSTGQSTASKWSAVQSVD